MEKVEDLNFKVVSAAFESKGWKMYHQFMVGNYWVKGDNKLTCFYGKYKLNGQPIDGAKIMEMLDLDVRLLQVAEAISPRKLYTKYGSAFLDGVLWADKNPIDGMSKK